VGYKILETVKLIRNLTIFIACYFNSLLQFYYTLPGFVQRILEFNDDDDAINAANKDKKEPQESGID